MVTQTITIGMQTSGEDSVAQQHVIELRKLLASECNGPYSEEVREFALILRVGGIMQEFDFLGCERIRRNRRRQYITLDLSFPSREWKGRDALHIRQFLVDQIETGIRCFVDRLNRDKVNVQGSELLADIARVKAMYLAAPA
jgi:hypothetical protein